MFEKNKEVTKKIEDITVSCQVCKCLILNVNAEKREALYKETVYYPFHFSNLIKEDLFYCKVHVPKWDYVNKTVEPNTYWVNIPATKKEVSSMGETLVPETQNKPITKSK